MYRRIANDDNTSVWAATKPPDAPRPPLVGRAQADVAVVGGGFTGVSAAWHLARRFPEKRIVLLEARALAHGASGRNGGLALNWINGVHSPDADHAARIYRVTQEGMGIIEEMIAAHALPVSFLRRGCVEVFTDRRRAEEMAAWVEGVRAAGLPLSYLSGRSLDEALQLEGGVGAVHDPNTGTLDGVAMLRAMRGVLVELGVGVYESTPVTSIREGSSIAIDTPRGELRAGAVVLATNAYTGALGYFRDGIFPLHSHVIASEPRPRQEWERIGWGSAVGFNDDLDRIAYGCLTDGGQLLFGGGSNAAYGYRLGGATTLARPPERGWAAVERRMRAYFPRAAEVGIAHRWSGVLGITMSRVCAMGVRGEHRNVFYAFGYSGHGITLAHLAGKVLTDVYAGDDARWRGLPFYQPRIWPLPPEPLRWMGYQLYTRVTGRSPRRAH